MICKSPDNITSPNVTNDRNAQSSHIRRAGETGQRHQGWHGYTAFINVEPPRVYMELLCAIKANPVRAAFSVNI